MFCVVYSVEVVLDANGQTSLGSFLSNDEKTTIYKKSDNAVAGVCQKDSSGTQSCTAADGSTPLSVDDTHYFVKVRKLHGSLNHLK